jgi:hypothetical protein
MEVPYARRRSFKSKGRGDVTMTTTAIKAASLSLDMEVLRELTPVEARRVNGGTGPVVSSAAFPGGGVVVSSVLPTPPPPVPPAVGHRYRRHHH